MQRRSWRAWRRGRVAQAARRDGDALLREAVSTLERAGERHATAQIESVRDGLARRVVADPARLASARKTLEDLADAGELPDALADTIKGQGIEALEVAASKVLDAKVAGDTDAKVSRPALFDADIADFDSRTGSKRTASEVLSVFSSEEQAELRTLVQGLRDNGAPDGVIETTVRDVSQRVLGRRRTAMDPVTATLALGGIALSGLVATSLEAQRRRSLEVGRGGVDPEMFDRLIEAFRPAAADIIEQSGDDEADDLPPASDGVDDPVAAAEPPNPEDDPLFDLLLQTIMGQIVEQTIRERPEVRTAIDRHARELLPRIRELYPDGIRKKEVRRIVPLGDDSDIEDFRALEVFTGVRLERQLATTLERSGRGGDWVDPHTLETYDAILGNIPDHRFFTIEGFVKSLRSHLLKTDVDRVVVDIGPLSDAQRGQVTGYINTQLDTETSSKS